MGFCLEPDIKNEWLKLRFLQGIEDMSETHFNLSPGFIKVALLWEAEPHYDSFTKGKKKFIIHLYKMSRWVGNRSIQIYYSGPFSCPLKLNILKLYHLKRVENALLYIPCAQAMSFTGIPESFRILCCFLLIQSSVKRKNTVFKERFHWILSFLW